MYTFTHLSKYQLFEEQIGWTPHCAKYIFYFHSCVKLLMLQYKINIYIYMWHWPWKHICSIITLPFPDMIIHLNVQTKTSLPPSFPSLSVSLQGFRNKRPFRFIFKIIIMWALRVVIISILRTARCKYHILSELSLHGCCQCCCLKLARLCFNIPGG